MDGTADAAYQQAEHDSRGPATTSEQACTVSHALALATAARHLQSFPKLAAALVVEDDVTLGLDRIAKWPVSFPAIVAELPEDWEYLQLYTPNPRIVRGPKGLLSQDPQLGTSDASHSRRPSAIRRISTKVFGTQAYLVSRKGLERLQKRHQALAADAPQKLRLEHWTDVRLVSPHP